MKVERGPRGFTEAGWVDYGLRLQCGHGISTVENFGHGITTVEGRAHGLFYWRILRWQRLDSPLLLAELGGRDPGAVFRPLGDGPHSFRLTGRALSAVPLGRIGVVVTREVVERIKPPTRKT